LVPKSKARATGPARRRPQPIVQPTAAPAALAAPLRVAVAAVAIEAAALAASAIGLSIYALAGHRPHDSADLWFVVVLAVVGAVGLGLVTRGLGRARRWGRSPAVLTQLIVVPIGGSSLGHGGVLVGVPLIVVGIAGLVGLFAPSTSQRLAEA